MAKHDHLNTFKICEPEGTEQFPYKAEYLALLTNPFTKQRNIHTVLLVDVKNVKKVIDFYIDFTDYTLYNTKLLTFHHLN